MMVKFQDFELNPKITKEVGINRILSALDENQIQTQIAEIFIKKHYSRGIWKENMVVVDLGANIGLASLFFRKHAKIIYALEPSPVHYFALEKNTKTFPNIKTFKLGIAGGNGKTTLKTNDGGTIAESLFGNGTSGVSITVSDLESFMKKQKIRDIDLLKIDVEGTEYSIFCSEGFQKVAPHIKRIIGEAHFQWPFIPQMVKPVLEESGFRVKFLGYNNSNHIVTIGSSTGLKKNYEVTMKTIFLAERK